MQKMLLICFLGATFLFTSCANTPELNVQETSNTEIEMAIENFGEDEKDLSSRTAEFTLDSDFITENFGESLVGDVEILNCTLSGGSETECYKFTVAPDATLDHEIGPWCPRNISDTEIAGGIWPEDGNIYTVSGEFIENLAVFYADDSWQLYDISTGEINVTDTQISCEGAAKPDVEEEYQNHCVECSLSYMDEIPNVTYTIPVVPQISEETQNINSQLGTGVAFNGIKFDASAPTEQILAANTIAPFDDCGGHINLAVGYHYHESTGCSKQVETIEDHEAMIGIALDGVPMHQQIDSENSSDLDACGGHIIDGVYHYHIGETGRNQFLGCYAAEYGCVSNDSSQECDMSDSQDFQGPPDGNGPPPRR